MRLLSLTVRNFRGFGSNPPTIDLDGDLVLFFGPNGFGKTSLAEAIEWLFYGTTKRRQYGETYSRAEYADSFANAHGGTPTEVSAKILFNGRDVLLSRRLTNGDDSETFVDGVAAPFSSIAVSPLEAVYPVVAQHGLQTFVHSKPKDRRDAICAALGLDELTTLKNTLDSARTSFQRTPPRSVTLARNELALNARVLAQISETTVLARRWSSMPPGIEVDVDLDALLAAAKALTGQDCPAIETALGHLRDKRGEATRSVFDAKRLVPGVGVLGNLHGGIREVYDDLEKVERAVAAVVAVMASTYSGALLELWQKGLEISEGDECALCEEHTLTSDKRAKLSKRLAENADRIAKNGALIAAIASAKGRISRAEGFVREFGADEPLDTAKIEQLKHLFVGRMQELNAFLESLESFHEVRKSILDALDNAEEFLEDCATRLDDPRNAPFIVEEIARNKDAARTLTDAAPGAFASYAVAWESFEPQLGALVSSNEVIGRIDAVGKSLKAEQQIRLLGRYDDILKETQELIRVVESEMQQRQGNLLVTRGGEVKDIYDRLNRGANVVFDQMEPGTDSMKLHATSFGTRMSAAANLSECQLNCLGLSMWLMRATTPSSPFSFVLLDDPVQSMDDDHTEAFITDIVPFLLDQHGKQVIVLSHVKRITERLRELNGARSAKLYHYESYERDGPTVTEQVKLQQMLAEIEGAARGNEANRKYAVDRIRVLIEHFIRELHLQVMGIPAPSPQYDRATAKDLLPLFQSITGTTQQEHVGLRDSIRFCDPAHHTQVGYSIPVQSNIQPHTDRLKGLIKKYGL